MTSEQQIKSRYKITEVVQICGLYFIKVTIDSIPFLIGYGTSKGLAYTDAMQNLGIKRMMLNKRTPINKSYANKLHG